LKILCTKALCADRLFPFIHYFAKGHGRTNDPFRAYFLTLFIACSVILIGELNAIAGYFFLFFFEKKCFHYFFLRIFIHISL
jgi:hypothetical protein